MTDSATRKTTATDKEDPPKTLLTLPAVNENLREVLGGIAHLEYVVRYGQGQDAVRSAAAELASAIAEHIDNAAPGDVSERANFWRRQIRHVYNADGSDIDEAGLKSLRGDVAAALARQATAGKAAGLKIARNADGGFVFAKADGTPLLTMPRLAGQNVLDSPGKFAAQMQLLQASMAANDPEDVREFALNVFANVHERDHEFLEQRLLYEPTEQRAETFLSALRAVRTAETPEARARAEATLRTALFAEAAPSNRLIYLGLDLLTPIGNVNAGGRLGEEVSNAAEAFSEGRLVDFGSAAMWGLVELVGAVGGFRAGKLLETAASTTGPGRRIAAARKLAKMEDEYSKPQRSWSAETILGSRRWSKLTEYQRSTLSALLRLGIGVVGEGGMLKQFKDVKANSFKNAEAARRTEGLPPTPAKDAPTRIKAPQHISERLRYMDDSLEGQKLKRIARFFLFPEAIPGKKTHIEHKGAAGKKSGDQRKVDDYILENLEDFDAIDVLALRTPFEDMPKMQIYQLVKHWMKNPKGATQEHVTLGRRRRVPGSNPPRYITVKWTEAEVDNMLKDVHRSLLQRPIIDEAPTIQDYLLGVGARIAAEIDDAENKAPNISEY